MARPARRAVACQGHEAGVLTGSWNLLVAPPLEQRSWVFSQEAGMGLFSKDIKTLDDLFLHGLQDIYYAENQIIKALPKMIENTTNAQLKKGFETHLAETENQVKRLEQVFEMLPADSKGKKCPAIDGILSEGDEVMGEVADPDVRDVAIVAAAHAVEHDEMTRYGALIAWASELGRTDSAAALKKNLAEEKATDQKLTAMAERRVNPAAAPSNRARARKTAQAAPRRAAKKAKRAPAKSTRRRA
jgi:ferritin-like metal-binding protein YciE